VQENRGTHRTGCLAVLFEVPDPIYGLQRDERVGLAGSRALMTSPRLRDVLDAEAGGARTSRVIQFFTVEEKPFIPSANLTVAGRRYEHRRPGGPVDWMAAVVLPLVAHYLA